MEWALETTMGKARDFKKRADTMLEELFRSMFEEIDIDKLRREVEELRERTPDFAPKTHARMLTRRTAIRCAAAGAVTGIPMGIAALGTLSADIAYLVYQQFRLILGIAIIYGHAPTSRERFAEAMECLAYGSGVGVGKHGIATVLRDRLAKMIPFVGVISGGALNYAAVYAVARSAVRHYESRVDPLVADEIWSEGDREHA
jgi:hypothetical protein